MNQADLQLGLSLSGQAGWNQTVADWQRVLSLQPDGCFVAEWDGRAVGTAATTVLGHVAWISMVLVDESNRGRGIGRALLEHALAYLDGRGVPSVRLDATSLGRPLYESLGFVAQYNLARFAGKVESDSTVPGIATASSDDWERLAELDAEVTGTDRRALLFRLFTEQPTEVRCGSRGYVTARTGSRATLIGPCIASPEDGAVLLADALRRHAGKPIYVDVPLPNVPAHQFAVGSGLQVQRQFTRMCRGAANCERLSWLWASSGPEKG
jgi:predicted GNAT family acetyltransferase